MEDDQIQSMHKDRSSHLAMELHALLSLSFLPRDSLLIGKDR